MLVRLVVVRESLLRRLKSVEIAAEAARLVALQRKAMAATQSLPGQAAVRRESAHLAAIEDQRNASALCRRFQAELREVSQWTGPLGEEARRGLDDLKRAEFDRKLARAEERLEQGAFTEAAQCQKEIIEGLGRLMERLPTQAKDGMPSLELSARVRTALDKQQAICRQARQDELDTAAIDELTRRQIELRKEITALAEQARDAASQEGSAGRQALEKAKQAAAEAAARLFEQDQAQAIQKQEEVVAQLKQAATSLASLPAKESSDQPAKNVARTEELAQTTSELESLEKEQQAVTAAAEHSDQTALAQVQQRESEVVKRLGQLPHARTLPDLVERQIRQAEDSAGAAVQAMDRRDSLAAEKAWSAGQAIQRAVSEAKTALADRQREELFRRLKEKGRSSEDEQAKDLVQELERTRRQQLDGAQKLQEAVERNLTEALRSPAQALGSLTRSKEKTTKAIEAQDRAAELAAKIAEQATQDKKGHARDAAAKAEERATQAAQEAAAQARAVSPGVAAMLEKAAAASAQAQKAAASGEDPKAADARLAAGQSLRQAMTQLEQAQRKLRGQMARQAAEQSSSLKELVQRAVSVDAAATAALQEASRQAQRAGDASPGSKDTGSPQAGQAIQSALSQAAASLVRRVDQLAAEGGSPSQASSDAKKPASVASRPGGFLSPSSSSPGERGSQEKEASAVSSASSRLPAQGAQTSGAAAPSDVSLRDALMQDAWFARLPPEVRGAIRSHSQRRPPRGYEERMQNYFSDKVTQ